MKNILSFIIATVMFFSMSVITYAEDNLINEIDPNEELELSLEKAIDYALKHSRDVKIQDLEMKKAQLQYDQGRSGARELEEQIEEYENLPNEIKSQMRGEVIPIIERELLELGVLDRQAKLTRQIAIWNKAIKENEIKYNVEKAYFDLLQSEKELEIARESLELANRQYEQSQKMYELGTISHQQLLSAEFAVFQAQSSLDMATIGYEVEKMNFNNTLGLPLGQKIKLTDKIEYKNHDEINLEEAIKTALENSALIKVAKERYELSELTFKAVRAKHVTPNQFKYREQEIAVEQAAKSLDTAKNGVEMQVRAAYYSLITAEKQIKTYERAVENTERAYELVELSYKLGQNTSNDVTKARIDLMDARKSLSKQIHAYNLALLDFKYAIGLGKSIVSGGF